MSQKYETAEPHREHRYINTNEREARLIKTLIKVGPTRDSNV